MSLIKSETKVIRPFLGAHDVRTALNCVELHLMQNDPEALKEVRFVSDMEEDGAPYINLNLTEDDLKKVSTATKIDSKNIALLIWGSMDSAKRSFPIFDSPVSSVHKLAEINLPKNLFEYAHRRGGVVISVALILSKQLPPTDLRPSKLGQWLVKKDFKLVGFDDDSSKVDIQELTPDIRKKFSIPEGAAYFVDLSESATLAEPHGALKDAMTIYFEADSLQRLRRATKASDAVQIMILSQIIPDLILSSIKRAEISQFNEIDTTSPLFSLLKNVSKSTKTREEDVFSAILTSPERFKTFIQADIQAIRAIKEMIRCLQTSIQHSPPRKQGFTLKRFEVVQALIQAPSLLSVSARAYMMKAIYSSCRPSLRTINQDFLPSFQFEARRAVSLKLCHQGMCIIFLIHFLKKQLMIVISGSTFVSAISAGL